MVKHAIYDVAQFKALDGDNGEEEGRFEALVSVFGNVDKIGDRVVKGAFAGSLAEWRAKGAPIPIIWNHQWGDAFAHIGSADPNEVTETDAGLLVKGTVDLDNPFAAQVFRLMKGRRVGQFSFGYEVKRERKAKDGANELLDLHLFEVGPTLRGVNPSTELLAVKAELEAAAHLPEADLSQERVDEVYEIKAGRTISRATEAEIRAVIEENDRVGARLRGLLATAGEDDEPDDDEKSAEVAQTDGDPKGQTAGVADLSDAHLDLVTRIAVLEERGK
jgi:HK97 family phage prohead protease